MYLSKRLVELSRVYIYIYIVSKKVLASVVFERRDGERGIYPHPQKNRWEA